MASVKYEVHEERGEGLALNPVKAGRTIGYVVRNGDRKVWSTGMYFEESLQGRARSAAKARAAKARNSYQSYFDRTGKCWEVEQDVKEGKELFEAELKALVELTERKLAAPVFAMLRNGCVGGFDPEEKKEVLELAIKTIINLMESRGSPSGGHQSRYRKIRAYADQATRSLSAEAANYFSF